MEQTMQDALLIPPAGTSGIRVLEDLDTTDAELVAEFSGELDDALKQLKAATDEKAKVDKSLSQLQDDLKDRSWFSVMGATFTAKTDKELASLIEGLGKSLDLTQNVVRVVLKVATQKNRVLQSFNAALVDKITAIQSDTHTLNTNQKKVALHFLGELKGQIDEQLRHHELVDSHDVRLDDLDHWRQDKDAQGNALDGAVSALSLELDRAHTGTATLASHLGEIEQARRSWQQEKESGDAALTVSVKTLSVELAQARDAIGLLTSRLAVLEQERRQARTLRGLVVRSLPSLVALAIGIAALVVALR